MASSHFINTTANFCEYVISSRPYSSHCVELLRAVQVRTIELAEIEVALGLFMKVGTLGVSTVSEGERGETPTPLVAEI